MRYNSKVPLPDDPRRIPIDAKIAEAKANGQRVSDVLTDEEFSFRYGGLNRPTPERLAYMQKRQKEAAEERRKEKERAKERAEKAVERVEAKEVPLSFAQALDAMHQWFEDALPLALMTYDDLLHSKNDAQRERIATKVIDHIKGEEARMRAAGAKAANSPSKIVFHSSVADAMKATGGI